MAASIASAGVAAWWWTHRSDAVGDVVAALDAPARRVATASGGASLLLPGGCTVVANDVLVREGGAWSGAASVSGVEGIACGGTEEEGDRIVAALAEDGAGRLPPVVVLHLPEGAVLVPDGSAASAANLLAGRLADLDEIGADGTGSVAYRVGSITPTGSTPDAAGAGFVSEGPHGPRGVRIGEVRIVGRTVVAVVVTAPTGHAERARTVLRRAVGSIRLRDAAT